MEYELKKRKNILIIGILSLLIILMGSTYAFFSYTKGSEAFVLSSKKISAIFTSGTNSVTFTNAYPISDQFALNNLDRLTYIDFIVASEAEDESQAVEYEIYLTESDTNTLSSDYLKVYLTDENNKKIVDPTIYSNLETSTYDAAGKVIFKDNNPGQHSKNYRLYVWLDQEYSQNDISQVFSFKVNLFAYNDKNQNLNYVLTNAIQEHTTDTCNPIVEDDDGTIYFSGTNDCVNFNYVWYSGKLWRITSINPDGTMKMVTDGLMTTIAYGANNKFYTDENTSSYMYQWLNQEFLPTLYNYEEIIVEDAVWNASPGNGEISSKLPIEGQDEVLVNASVGLLNSYEYYKSYQNTSFGSGYLNIGYYWWLLNPYSVSSSTVRYVNVNGNNNYDSPSRVYGVRPSIYLKSGVQLIGGTGTESNPYRIKRDQEQTEVNVTLINTRQSGEYVNFDEELYRIVGIENETTKLIKVDYVKDESSTILTKAVASSTIFGNDTNSQTDNYWDYYLNKTWKPAIEDDYEEMLVEGNYYTKYFTGDNYKNTACATVSNATSIKDCDKTGVSTWSGYVGLPRYGEMFASPTRDYTTSNAKNMWLITPYGSSSVWFVNNGGGGYSISPGNTNGGRPTIHLKSEIVIKGGSGTKNDPFIVGFKPR